MLVEKVKAGDEQAFRLLIERYKNDLFKAIYPILRNDMDAEDVTQEVFLKIYYALPQYNSQGLKTWMTRIAINHAIDLKRKKQRQHETVVEPEVFSAIPQPDCTTIAVLLRKEQREVVRNRLDEMPASYRDVIYAHYIIEKSYQQIADEQKVGVKAIEMKLYRARNWMKKHWKEDDF
ncbi:sigma-70 family RNA polymerase sigma factor [Sporosarcina sp. YIM B06819]|uniref:sigma-70 family RNA polymerase sigma factor n=1 Tax=Sporosarcina sp. YIM B06819 TaxID=3081769 RepID=UPI00298CD549|nr:sigma-70 family RNA polymerase sigma factor [Sporosarcina sp. YIM B06819]